MSNHTCVKSTQVQEKPKSKRNKGPCPWLCNLVPQNVPPPARTREVLHPRKDVFTLKVAKVSATGDRRCKMELELVTPKYNEKKPVSRIDTRETQFDPPSSCICCCNGPKRRRKPENAGKQL